MIRPPGTLPRLAKEPAQRYTSARALAEFDAARGYDKPLFFGNWTATRALETVDFESAPPSNEGTCTMCGKMCAVRTVNTIMDGLVIDLDNE